MNYKKLITTLSISAIAVILTTGCSTKTSQMEHDHNNVTNDTSTINSASMIESLKAQNTEKDKKIAALQAKIENQAKEENLNDEFVLQNAKPGECYAKVQVPAEYKLIEKKRLLEDEKEITSYAPAVYDVKEEKVTIREATTKLKVIPATYKTITEKIIVEPEMTKLELIPATYKTVTEKILVQPEMTKTVVVPATYKTMQEKVIDVPAHKEWKKGRGAIEKVDNSTGEIMCLVEVPATYKTISRKILDKPSTTKTVTKPAVYKTITKRVVDQPSVTKEIKVPAVYKTITKKVIDKPATTQKTIIPGICKTIEKKVLVTPEKKITKVIPAVYQIEKVKVKVKDETLKWQSILCETNMKEGIVKDLQRALKEKKYDITFIDGIYGKETQAAVQAYQKDKGLSQGALTLETLKSLNLK